MSAWLFSRSAREARKEAKLEDQQLDREERDAREALLVKAANNAEVHLVCHIDTWDFIHARCNAGLNTRHFMPPGAEHVDEDGGGKRQRIPVSGRTLAAILDQMIDDAQPGTVATVDQAMAVHIRDTIVRALDIGEELRFIVIDSHPDDGAHEEGG